MSDPTMAMIAEMIKTVNAVAIAWIDERDKRIADLERQLAEAQARVKELEEALSNYGEHEEPCILARYEAGRPNEQCGYEFKYAGKWYAEDKLPKCTCGLDLILCEQPTEASK